MKNTRNLPVGQQKPILPLCPGTLFTLLDIMRFISILDLTALFHRIEHYKSEADWQNGKILSKKRAQYIRDDLHRYIDHWTEMGWRAAWNRLAELCNFIQFGNDIGSWKKRLPAKEFTVLVRKSLEDLAHAINADFDDRCFLMIEESKRDFLELDDLFGKLVSEKFPSAKEDIKAAGNCLAVDLNTAAIFHLMRIVERGLRAFARHLRVPIPSSELEYKNWQTIINQIPNAINAKMSGKKMAAKRRSELLEFYSGVTGQFEFFKDVWRNHCSHSRVHYDAPQAQSAFDHVKNFMQRLATRVSETKH